MSWYFRQHALAVAGGAGSITLWGFAPGVRQGGAASRWERRSLLCPGALGTLLRSPALLRRGGKKSPHPDWTRAPRRLVPPLPQPRVHLAFPPRPAPVSRQMTQFDTPAGQSRRIMFLRDHLRKKAISIAFFFIKHNNDEVMERLYCSRAKTHYSCQTSEYKRNYKMAFCTRSAPIACLGDWGRGGKGREGELICVNFSSESQTGGKGLTTTQNAFCVRGIWLPAGILMVSQCTAAVKMMAGMPSTPDSFGKRFFSYGRSRKDCEWTYFSNCRLVAAGHMLPKLFKTISVGSYYHVQMDFRRGAASRRELWLGIGFHISLSYLPLCSAIGSCWYGHKALFCF